LEMIEKLGWLSDLPFSVTCSWPLYRTNAVRRETRPCASSEVKVTTTYLPSGKSVRARCRGP